MTRDDIIRMAREAGGFLAELPQSDAWLFYEDWMLEDFAKLVAAAEREACAKLCDGRAEELEKWYDERKQHMSGYGIAFNGGVTSASRRCASSIRARGQQ